jgi:hypothetical protein
VRCTRWQTCRFSLTSRADGPAHGWPRPPLTHGIAAGREVAGGASLASVSGLVWTEVAVGSAWAILAFTLVHWFEYEGRRRASLETF